MKRFINNHCKQIISCMVVFAVLMSTVFSSISIKKVFATSDTIEYWDNTAATAFAGGTGADEDPYLISTASQLYKAISDLGKNTDGSAAYYLMTNDIYINKDYDNYANWETTPPANNWNPTRGDFIGHLDGDYHTIYGLYSSTNNWRNGLIPYMNSGATVSNLIITKAYIHNGDSNAAAIAGTMYNNTKVDSCLVYDAVVSAGYKDIGGIVGSAAVNTVTISNCGTYNLTLKAPASAGGILGRSWQNVSGGNGVRVLYCFSVDNFPVGDTNRLWALGTYTNAEGTKGGITTIEKEKMQGAGAVANMKLNASIWHDTNGFPTLSVLSEKAGDVWTGVQATCFSGGTGTETDPYIIETASQLYKAISDLGKNTDGSAAYYLMTNDIYINKDYDNYANWETTPPANNWNPTRGDFIGHLDGDYHTIYGLYSSTDIWRNGLIPYMNSGATVSNLIITKAYIHNGDSNAAAIAGTMYSNTKVDSCLVYDAVVSAGYKDIGGIVGSAAVNTVTISNCGTYNLTLKAPTSAGGILGRSWQNVSGANGVRVLYCFSVDNFPVGDTNRLWALGTYTNAEGTKGGITTIEKEKMQGAGAVANMNLNASIWHDTNDFPTLSGLSEKAGDVWTGVQATRFSGGTGTETDPYIIETASQLFKAVSDLGKKSDGSAAYYLMTNDIYLNKNYQNYASWGETAPDNNWLPINSSVDFVGHIDGNGHTVYGLYTRKSVWCAGLIARVNGGSIRDLNVSNSYIYSVGGTVGGIVGMAYAGTTVSRCKVSNAIIVDKSNTDLGAIVGAAQIAVMITACASYDVELISSGAIGGILGRAWSSANIRECYSIGNYPIGSKETNRMGCHNVFTDNNSIEKSGITVLSQSDMKGSSALEKMPLVSSFWVADANGYPVLREYNNGVKGAIWTGAIAENYASGNGTAKNPYIIETGEQLYKMVYENCVPGNVTKEYKLAADIRLNNTSDAKWYDRADINLWHITKAYTFSFAGHFEGNGHTVAGIRTNSESGNAYAGLIPVLEMGSSVKNVGVIDSYIATSSSVAENYTGSIVGWIDDWDSTNPVTEENTPVISGCFADNTVTLSGMYCGGILSGVAAPVLVENCYFTGNFDNYSSSACIIGNIWTKGSKVKRCYAANSAMESFAAGRSVQRYELEYEACYNFGKGAGANLSFVGIYDIRGEKAKTALKGFDFENVWQTVEGGTPVLRVFGSGADKFSSKEDVYVTVSFVSNVADMTIAPIRGLIGSLIDLPQPTREGYNFAGWYVYSELQCKYTDTTFPFIDLILYAKWEPKCVVQDFESYPNTEYDLDNDYVYFRPGVANYNGSYVYSGNKSLKRLGNSSERQDFLVKYETELTVGKEYTISFWMMTETEGATGEVSMFNATWPDIAEPVLGVEMTIAEYQNLSVGKWQQYKYTFTALTPWVTMRTDGDTVLYFDDILVYPNN